MRMIGYMLAIVATVLLSTLASALPVLPAGPLQDWTEPVPWTPAPIPAQRCCKTCSKGKACGDSCISRGKNCRKGPGCACDG